MILALCSLSSPDPTHETAAVRHVSRVQEAEEQPPAEQPLSPQGGEGKGAAGTEQKKTLTEQGNFLSGVSGHFHFQYHFCHLL